MTPPMRMTSKGPCLGAPAAGGGETDGTEPDLYGIAVTHRRSAWRNWLFFEFGAELFWADGPLPADRCTACVGAAVGFEILFGDAYDRMLSRDAERLPSVQDSRDDR